MPKDYELLEDQLCFSFYTLNKYFNQLYNKALKEFGLTYTQYLVMTSLWEEPEQTLNQIGQKLGLASNTLTPLLKRLEERGLLKRQVPSEDKRQLLIEISPAGQQLKDQVQNQLRSCLREIRGLDHDTAQNLLTANKELIKIFEDNQE